MHTGLQDDDERALTRAIAACQHSRAVDTLTLDAVRHPRERRGNSWTQIDVGLSITRQGATKKYADRAG